MPLTNRGLPLPAMVTLVLVMVLAALVAGASAVSAQGTVPDAPDQPIATAVFVAGVDLEWNDVPGADSYDVQLYRNGQWIDLPGEGVEIAFYGAGAIISGLDPNSTLWFQVRAENAHGSSGWSNFSSVASTNQFKLGRRARPDNVPASGAPVINDTAQVGEILTVDTTGIEDGNGLDRVQFRFQWVSHDGSADTDIASATDSTYTLAAGDEGKTIKVRVAFTDRGGYAESLTGAATEQVAPSAHANPAPTPEPAQNSPATGSPAVTGTAQVGEALSADISGIGDADGLANVSYSYQWVRNDGTSDTDITGAADSSYILVAADEGKTIKVRVAFTDRGGYGESLTSAATATVAAAPNNPATGAPTISGTARVGEPLTADTSGIADTDGLTNVTYSYQWITNDGTADSDITSATDSTYILVAADEGKTIKVEVSFTDDAGNGETLTSAATSSVAARPNSAATGAPTISGTAHVEETLTAGTSGIGDADGLTNVSYNYQWIANDGTSDTNITGATDSSYILVAADEGKTIKVRVSFTDDAANDEVLTSTETEAVSFAVQQQIVNNPATGAPTISGAAQVGEALTADTSGIADTDGLVNATYRYQWMRNDGTSETDIQNATGSTYTLVDNDEGQTIKVKVSFTDDAGNDETLSSGATDAVAAPECDNIGDCDIEDVDDLLLPDLVSYVHEYSVAEVVATPDGTEFFALRFAGFVTNLGDGPLDLRGNPQLADDADLASHDVWQRALTIDGDWVNLTKPPIDFEVDDGHDHFHVMGIVEYSLWDTSGTVEISSGAKIGFCLIDVMERPDLHANPGPKRHEQWDPDNYYCQSGRPRAKILHMGVSEGWQDIYSFSETFQWIDVSDVQPGYYRIGQRADPDNVIVESDETNNELVLTQRLQVVPGYVARPETVSVEPDAAVRFKLSVDEYFDDTNLEDGSPRTRAHRIVTQPSHGSLDVSDTVTVIVDGATHQVFTDEWVTYTPDPGYTGVDSFTFVALDESRPRYPINPVVAKVTVLSAGKVGITGFPRIGEVLTATTTGIADADGFESASFNYQWIRNDGGADADITGATDSNYVLVDADWGSTIKVRVSFTDDAGYAWTLTSEATAQVSGYPGAPELPVGTAVFIGGVDLEWDDVIWADSYDVQLFRNGQWTDLPADDVAIAFYGAGAIISGLDPESSLWFRVRAENAHSISDWSEMLYMGSTNESTSGRRAKPDNVPASGAPVISGTAQLGESLTADTTGIEDGNGLDRVQFRFQWVSHDGSADADIASATDYTYTLLASDEGKTIKVRVAFTDRGGYAESLTSAATATVAAAASDSPATGAPVITGTAEVGETLTADTTGVADADGLSGATFTYRWIANDGTADTDIQDAMDSTYTLVAADEGKTIKVRVSFTDDAGNVETLTSSATAAVDAAPNTPATGASAITGTAQVGETLAADTSGIADADGLTKVSYSYQWVANDGTADTDITDATDSTYTLSAPDEGKTIKVKVSFTDDRNNKETLTSEATAAVAATVPGAPQNVQISLSASHALDVSWEAPASNGGSFVTGYKLQWKSGEDDYNASREATKYGHQMYRISGLRSGVLYTIRVIAMNNVGDGLPSAEVSDSPLSDLDRLRRFIATDVVEAHESSHPWLRTTWEYMKSGFDLKVGYQPPGGGSVEDGCSYEDGLQKCRAESMEIGGQSVNDLGLLLHEMAHVFTLTNGLVDEPAPLGAAHLYFNSLYMAEPSVQCVPGEIFADILQLSVVGVSADQGTWDSIAGYWDSCNGDYEAGHTDPLTEEALSVVNSALSGQMPQWFADTYHDSNGNADLEQLWSDVKSMERGKGGRFVVAYRLREQFGGYCGNPQVAGVLDIASSSERVSDNEIRNPWRDGGCVPEAPGGLRVVPGSNQLELSWEVPVDDGGSSIRGYAVEWKSGDEDYDESRRTVIDDPSSLSHTVTGLTEGVEHTLRVTAFNVFGDGEYATVTNLNRPATGAPPISGTARVGETLTASTSGIADEDGLSDPTYSYKWIRNDGTTDSVIRDATSSTYTLTDDDAGKTIKVRVSFTDDGDNEEMVTSDPTAVVAATVPGVPQHVRVTPHDSQALEVSWEAPTSDGGSAVTGYKVQWKKATGSWDTPEDVSEAVVTGVIHTIAGLTEGTAYSVRVLASNEVGDGSASAELAGTPRDITPPSLSTATVNEAVMTLTYDEALDENSVPASETFSVTTEDAPTTVDSVSVSGSSVTLTLSSAVTTDVAVTVSYAVPADQTAARIKDSAGNAAPALSSQAVVNVTEQSGNDNSALWSATMTVGVSNGLYGYESFYFRLGALSDRTITLDGSVYTVHSLAYYSSSTGSLVVTLDRALQASFLLRLDGFEFASDDAWTSNGATAYVYSWPKGQLSWSLGDQVQVSVVHVETSQQPEPAENSPATGLPTISGTAQAGQTLTADTSGIADDDGLTNVSYSYQWILNDGSTDTNIQDATGSGYTLVATDAGKTIKVKVTFNDDADNEETLISTATAEVAAGAPTDPPGIPRNLTGTANAEGTVTLRWDAPNDDSVTGYQILRRRPREGEGTLLVHVNDTGSTATEYTDIDVTPDVGHAYRVKAINAVRLSRQSNFVNVTPTQPAEPAQNSPAAGAPTISGTAQVGETLTAHTSGIGDADGLNNVTYSYQWIRNDGSTDTDIQNATGSSYTLVDVDEGKTIKVDVSFADDAGNDETLSSGATDVVAAPEPPAKPTGLSAVVSHDTVTLTWDNPQDDAITGYVILRRDREIHPQGTFVTITDDTGSADTTYTDDTVEPDKEYVYRIKAINEHGEVSEESDWVRGFTPAAPPTDSPATGEPTITGTAQVGQTLTVDTSGIADEDGLDNAVFAYQWLSDDAEIGGATGSTYTLVDDDEGQTIKVRVTVTDDLGNETTLTSAATEAVEAAPPTDSPATGEPTITGTAQVGQTLTVDTSGIADEDGLDNAVFAYQWLSDDAEIGGATGSTYTLVDDDEGQTIKVRVTVTDDLGNETTLTSAATEAVEAAPQSNSPATGEPTITGTAQVGQTLTVDTSGIGDEDGLNNVSYSYQWVVTDGGAYFDISGETGATYTLVAADRGLYILVRVSFTDDAGKREALTSAATDVVAAAA